jgi:heme/copper-type cytochrome/quinol oxidase subunit 3
MALKPIATTRSATGVLTAKLALWWLLASEIVIFGGVNTFILLTSSLSAVLAHRAAELKDGPQAAKLLGLTILGGAGFLCVKSVEWYGEITHGFVISANGFWSFYYTAAGIHGLHVIIGMICMAWVANSARKNEELHRVELVGIYWHFVDLVWIFLFPLLYIAK